jgi:hypothetical protein
VSSVTGPRSRSPGVAAKRSAGPSKIWRLSYELNDKADDVRWSVTATVVADASTEAVIVLDRSLTGDSFVRPPVPKPPGCIPALIEAEELCCLDGGRALSTDVWGVPEEEAKSFADLLTSPERRLPVVGFTGRDDDVFDGGLLLPGVIGVAHVVFVPSTTSRRLDSLLPEGLNVYGGAVRLWWPRLDASGGRPGRICRSSKSRGRPNHPPSENRRDGRPGD